MKEAETANQVPVPQQLARRGLPLGIHGSSTKPYVGYAKQIIKREAPLQSKQSFPRKRIEGTVTGEKFLDISDRLKTLNQAQRQKFDWDVFLERMAKVPQKQPHTFTEKEPIKSMQQVSKQRLLEKTANEQLFSSVKANTGSGVRAALGAKADVNAVDPISGETPLTMAVNNGNDILVALLLKRGADPNALNAKHEAPIIIAINKKRSHIAFKLLSNGANPNVRDEKGNTPLILSVIKNDVDTILRLFRKRANPNYANDRGETPLIVAIQRKASKLVSLLLDHGADPNIKKSADGAPLLVMAIKQNDDAIAKILITLGAREAIDINARDKDGDTALIAAAYLGKVSLVSLLLKHRADVTLTNNKGKTALQVAESRGNENIVTLLRARSPQSE